MNPTENQIQHTILEYLNYVGHYCWRNNTGSVVLESKGKQRYFRAGLKGSADILGVAKDGRMIAIEVKRKGGKATEEQLAFIREVASRGGYAMIAYDVADVEKFMNVSLDKPDLKNSGFS